MERGSRHRGWQAKIPLPQVLQGRNVLQSNLVLSRVAHYGDVAASAPVQGLEDHVLEERQVYVVGEGNAIVRRLLEKRLKRLYLLPTH